VNLQIAVERREIVHSVNEAVEVLEELTSDEPDWAEGFVLLAGCYGQKISVRPLQVIGLGAKYNEAIERAEELAPENPRVLLMRAIGQLNAPRVFGGDPEAGLKGLERAIAIFRDRQPSVSSEPSWGYEDALAWLGIARREAGDIDAARQAFESVLEVNPDFRWVKDVLLPELPPS
jgi:tetratricopeptide (TPR) repeat protein